MRKFYTYFDRMYSETIKNCNKFIQSTSDHEKLIGVYLTRALSYYNINEYNKASKDFDFCISLVPDDIMLNSLNGACKYELQYYDKALDLFKSSLDLYKKRRETNSFLPKEFEGLLEYNISEEFEEYIIEYIETTSKLSQEIIKNEVLSRKIEIAEEFNNRVRDYRRQQVGFLLLVIFLPVSLIVYNLDSNIVEIFDSLSYSLNFFLHLLPWAFLEVFFLSQYQKSTKYYDYYLHKLTIAHSVEKLRIEYFDHEKIEDIQYFRKFALQQYEKLYEPPFFIEKQSLFIKYDKNKLKLDSNVLVPKKN